MTPVSFSPMKICPASPSIVEKGSEGCSSRGNCRRANGRMIQPGRYSTEVVLQGFHGSCTLSIAPAVRAAAI